MDNNGERPHSLDADRTLLVFKYGGNAMRDEKLQLEILHQLADLREQGFDIVLVHGGGPFIGQVLDRAGIASEFIRGQRKTTSEAMPWIEMALKGLVNATLVRLFQGMGVNAVGLSGKDGRIATAVKYQLEHSMTGSTPESDLGQVGKVVHVDTSLLHNLLEQNYLPVICCIAGGKDNTDYNVNADFFAAAIAGALKADGLILLTDIDGLRRDVNDPATHISKVTLDEISELIEDEIVKGGMIPKLRACEEALQAGVRRCHILNGTKAWQIADFVKGKPGGTEILKSYATTE